MVSMCTALICLAYVSLFDGLMGTAISGLSNQRVLTPIEALAKQGAVKAATMGYAIGRVSDGVNVGTVTFGGVNAGTPCHHYFMGHRADFSQQIKSRTHV